MCVVIFSIVAILMGFAKCADGRKPRQAEAPEYPKYELTTIDVTPDSMILRRAEFVTNTVGAATKNLKTDDYEDTDDLVEETSEQSQRIFAIRVPTLKRHTSSENCSVLDPVAMTRAERRILDSLLNK